MASAEKAARAALAFPHLCNRVSTGTLRQYEASVQTILSATKNNLTPLTLTTYVATVQDIRMSTLRSQLAALRFYLNTSAIELMPEREWATIFQIIEGRTVTEAPAQRRGAATPEMLQAVVKRCIENGKTDIADGLAFQMAAVTRQRDVEALTWGQLKTDFSEVTVARKVCVRTTTGLTETHPITDEAVKQMLRERKQRQNGKDSDRVFLQWSQSEANDIIHSVAAEQGWDPELMWDGTHIFRHGGAVAAADGETERIGRAMTQGKWATAAVAEMYCTPNERRKAQRAVAARRARAAAAKTPQATDPERKAQGRKRTAPAAARAAPRARQLAAARTKRAAKAKPKTAKRRTATRRPTAEGSNKRRR